jgi:hypothetical protein
MRAFAPRLGDSLYGDALGGEWVEVEPGIFFQADDDIVATARAASHLAVIDGEAGAADVSA